MQQTCTTCLWGTGILSPKLDEPVSVHKLDYWMSLFLSWKRDGRMVDAIRQTVYSTSSLASRDICVICRSVLTADVAFFSKSSPFSRLRKALDVIVVWTCRPLKVWVMRYFCTRGPQALPTLFLFLFLLLSYFQSTKAFSFHNRSSLNFSYRLNTIFYTIAPCRIFKLSSN